MYRVLLSLHLISIISWMAGTLFLLRLFVYHSEEFENIVILRLKTWEERVSKIIVMPAMGLSFLFGVSMLVLSPELMAHPWMHIKLSLVGLLTAITVFSVRIRKGLMAGQKYSSRHLRILNEVPTLLMIIIIFMVILRPELT